MSRFNTRTPALLARHWGKLIALGATAVLIAAVLLSPTLRAAAEEYSRKALAWAGIGGAAAESGQTYWCPMHPEIKKTKPNEVCPICNMALVPLEGDANAEPPEHLTLTPRQVQQAGVVTRPAIRRPLYREIDTTGRIDFDETRLKKITSWVRGESRIQELFVDYTYAEVKEGQLLAKLYNENLIVSQRDYLRALEMKSSFRDIDLVSESEQRLRDQGMTPEQIQKLKTTGEAEDYVRIYATMTGTVIKRHVQEGSYVNRGQPLFEIADLSQVWLFADVYEEELSLVKVGQPVAVTVPSLPGLEFAGEVEYRDPVVNPETRTVRVRIKVENVPAAAQAAASHGSKVVPVSTVQTAKNLGGDPGRRSQPTSGPSVSRQRAAGTWQLIPGMFARVQLRHELGEHLAVPESAVLWSGQRRVVIVREGQGAFRPKEVRIGQRWLYPVVDETNTARGPRPAGSDGDKTESLSAEFAKAGLEFGAHRQRYHVVLDGLAPGDQVVTAGTFLLNAESSFQNVLAKMLPPESQAATLEEAVGEPVAAKLRALLAAYFDLSAALADDDLQAVPGRGESLARSADELARQAERENMGELAVAARRLATVARKFTDDDSTQPKVARTHFGEASHRLIRLLAEHGGKTLFEQDVYLFECGMAEVGYEKWLWKAPQLHNPYMGKKMLTCGKQLKVLKP